MIAYIWYKYNLCFLHKQINNWKITSPKGTEFEGWGLNEDNEDLIYPGQG